MADGAGLAEERIAADEGEVTEQFIAFLKAATAKRHPTGRRRRFNQGRATACVDAQFTVAENLPFEHRVGLFAMPATYQATIRFANAASSSDRERDIRGMSIRLREVAGPNLTPGSTSQDFVLNSHPVMMVADTRRFLELLRANEASAWQRALYFVSHPKALRIGLAARTNPTCHLDLTYWSATPYLFGKGRAVKYIVRPGSSRRTPEPTTLTDTYLEDAIRARLRESVAEFEFLVQFQADARRMPIEDASVEWRAGDAPYVPVARIRVPVQSIEDPEHTIACERMAFNPWNCLADHRPLGNMNRARRAIYEAMAAFRAEEGV